MKTNEILPVANSGLLSPTSRMNFQNIYRDKFGNIFYGSWRPPKLAKNPTDVIIQIKPEQAFRADAISYEYYDTPYLGWIIVMANDILNPFDRTDGLYVGRTIRVPDITSITNAVTL